MWCHAHAMSQDRAAADTRGWSPSRRRTSADHIAEALVRAGPDAAHIQLPVVAVRTASTATGMGQAIERALREGWTLSAAGTPPKGTVHTRRISGTARVVRAVGAGWSLVARTDGPAILLLDTAADVGFDIKDHALFPGPLSALTAAAARAQT